MSLGRQPDRPAWRAPIAIFIVWTLCGVFQACTIAPDPVAAHVASFSGNDQDGGFIGYLLPTDPSPGAITGHAEARYEALLAAGYAKGLILPIPGALDGLSPLPDGPHIVYDDHKPKAVQLAGAWQIDDEHLVLFGQMASAFRSGVKP